MPVSQADIDALRAALANEEKVVWLGDKRIEYRTVPEIEQALDRLIKDKAAEDLEVAGKRPVRQVRLYHGGRGYY